MLELHIPPRFDVPALFAFYAVGTVIDFWLACVILRALIGLVW